MDHLIQECPSRLQCHLLNGAKYILSDRAWVRLNFHHCIATQNFDLQGCIVLGLVEIGDSSSSPSSNFTSNSLPDI